MYRSVTPRLKHFPPGSLVTLKIDKNQYTIGQRKDDRYVWLSETSFAGLDCEVVLDNGQYADFWQKYVNSFEDTP